MKGTRSQRSNREEVELAMFLKDRLRTGTVSFPSPSIVEQLQGQLDSEGK